MTSIPGEPYKPKFNTNMYPLHTLNRGGVSSENSAAIRDNQTYTDIQNDLINGFAKGKLGSKSSISSLNFGIPIRTTKTPFGTNTKLLGFRYVSNEFKDNLGNRIIKGRNVFNGDVARTTILNNGEIYKTVVNNDMNNYKNRAIYINSDRSLVYIKDSFIDGSRNETTYNNALGQKNINRFNSNGFLTQNVNDTKNRTVTTDYSNDGSRTVTNENKNIGSKVTTTYNQNNQPVMNLKQSAINNMTEFSYNDYNDNGIKQYSRNFKSSQLGTTDRQTYFNEAGKPTFISADKTDSKGNLITSERTGFIYSDDTNQVIKETTDYNNNEVRLKSTFTDAQTGKKQQEISSTSTLDGQIIEMRDKKYSQGLLMSDETLDAQGNVKKGIYNTRDENNNITNSTTVKNGKVASTTDNTYNDEGKLSFSKTKNMDESGNTTSESRTGYIYSDDGNTAINEKTDYKKNKVELKSTVTDPKTGKKQSEISSTSTLDGKTVSAKEVTYAKNGITKTSEFSVKYNDNEEISEVRDIKRNEQGQLLYDETLDADGNVKKGTYNTRDENNNLINTTTVKDGKVSSTTDNEYNANGKVTKSITENFDSDGKTKSSKETNNTYNENGKLTYSKVENKDGSGNTKSIQETSKDYNENGKLTYNKIENKDGNGNTKSIQETNNEYNEKGKLTASTTVNTDGNGNTTSVKETNKNYNENGVETFSETKTTDYKNNKITSNTTSYDPETKTKEVITKTSTLDGQVTGSRGQIYENGRLISDETFDSDGNVTKSTRNEYNEDTKKLKRETVIDNGNKTVTEYNDAGKKISVMKYDKDGKVTSSQKYNDEGKLIEE